MAVTASSKSGAGAVCKACLHMSSNSPASTVPESTPAINTRCTRKWPRHTRYNSPGMSGAIVVSVIVPVHNALPWLDKAIESVIQQKLPQQPFLTPNQKVQIEVSMVDDCSTDASLESIKEWSGRLHARGFLCVYSTTQHEELVQQTSRDILAACGDSISIDATSVETTLRIYYQHQLAAADHPKFKPKGAGATRNQAVWQSCGQYLCILDADDVMAPDRIATQLRLALTSNTGINNHGKPLLIGSGFTRQPVGSTKHYTEWANSLTQERLVLEQYRELTIIQPTW